LEGDPKAVIHGLAGIELASRFVGPVMEASRLKKPAAAHLVIEMPGQCAKWD